jgi:hypothetical protein
MSLSFFLSCLGAIYFFTLFPNDGGSGGGGGGGSDVVEIDDFSNVILSSCNVFILLLLL